MDSEQEVDLHLFQEVFDSVVDIHKELNKDIIRIGLVAVKAELNNNPNKEIVKNYLSNNMQNDSEIIEDINLMYNKNSSLSSPYLIVICRLCQDMILSENNQC